VHAGDRAEKPFVGIAPCSAKAGLAVGAFSDSQSCLNLAAARLRHIAGTTWSTRRYMNMTPLRTAKIESQGAVVA